jgi:hypothetical protein
LSILPFDQLRSRLCGPSFTPADADYETSREIWNRLYDRRSSAVVRCESVSDVVASVRFAREYDLEIAVRPRDILKYSQEHFRSIGMANRRSNEDPSIRK